MKLEQFIDLVRTPASAGEEHISSIEKILSDYPFFQTAHLLYAKALHNSDHINYRNTLKRTAVFAGNRTVLYRLIQSPGEIVKFVEKEKEKTEPVILPKEEKALSSVSITYNMVPQLEPVKTESREEPVQQEQKPEIIQSELISKPETLDEVILKPVVEAYIDTEVLKITEKENTANAELSFTDWLKTIAEHTPVADTSLKKDFEKESGKKEESVKTRSKTDKQQLLDKLLKEDLRINKIAPDRNFYAATEKTRSSVIENEDLVTETLAKIYRLQGNNGKAIRAYEILSLKFPEKSAYFATLIQEIKNSIK